MGQSKADRRHEPKHIRLYASVTGCEAWRHLTGNAVKVLLALVARDNGKRNGAIGLSSREAAEIAGLSERTAWRCLCELQEKGFIRCTDKGAFSRKVMHSTQWRYTWQAWPGGSPSAPTRDFEKWRCVEIHGCKICNRTVVNCDEPSGNTTDADANSATDELENPLISVGFRSANIATLTLHHGEGAAAPETTARKQANPTSGPILAPLRERLIGHLQASEPGEQSRLATRVGIPAGTLSKFIGGRNLPERYRAALADAVAA